MYEYPCMKGLLATAYLDQTQLVGAFQLAVDFVNSSLRTHLPHQLFTKKGKACWCMQHACKLVMASIRTYLSV